MSCKEGINTTRGLSQEDMRLIGCYGCAESFVEYAKAKGSKHEKLRMRCHCKEVELHPVEEGSVFWCCDKFTGKKGPDGIWEDMD